MREHLITQEERLAWAERDARRHVGQLAGSCFCNVCTLLEEVHELRAQLATAQASLAEAQRRIQELEQSSANLQWSGPPDRHGRSTCPECVRAWPDGHQADCPVAKALAPEARGT